MRNSFGRDKRSWYKGLLALAFFKGRFQNYLNASHILLFLSFSSLYRSYRAYLLTCTYTQVLFQKDILLVKMSVASTTEMSQLSDAISLHK